MGVPLPLLFIGDAAALFVIMANLLKFHPDIEVNALNRNWRVTSLRDDSSALLIPAPGMSGLFNKALMRQALPAMVDPIRVRQRKISGSRRAHPMSLVKTKK